MAEWLRRWTRNPLGSPRAGSNPTDYGNLLFCCECAGAKRGRKPDAIGAKRGKKKRCQARENGGNWFLFCSPPGLKNM